MCKFLPEKKPSEEANKEIVQGRNLEKLVNHFTNLQNIKPEKRVDDKRISHKLGAVSEWCRNDVFEGA